MSDLTKTDIQNGLESSAAPVESIETQNILGGGQLVVQFANGYGASVVQHKGTIGDTGYEIAVLDDAGEITYDTPITSDVVPHADKGEVFDILDQIAKL